MLINKVVFGCILTFLSLSWGGGNALAVHTVKTTTLYKVLDIPYNIKITTIQPLNSNISEVTGVAKQSIYGGIMCYFDPVLKVTGDWIVEIENNSDIDFYVSDSFIPLKAHDTIRYAIYSNLSLSSSRSRWDNSSGWEKEFVDIEKNFYLYYNKIKKSSFPVLATFQHHKNSSKYCTFDDTRSIFRKNSASYIWVDTYTLSGTIKSDKLQDDGS